MARLLMRYWSEGTVLARMKFFFPGSWIYRYADFDRAEIASIGRKKIVLDYTDEDCDPQESPAKAVITLSNAQLYTPSQGFGAGQDLLRGGRIDRIVWKDEDGARQMVLDRIDLDPGVFLHSLRYSPYQTYALLTAQDAFRQQVGCGGGLGHHDRPGR